MTHRTMSECSYHGAKSSSSFFERHVHCLYCDYIPVYIDASWDGNTGNCVMVLMFSSVNHHTFQETAQFGILFLRPNPRTI